MNVLRRVSLAVLLSACGLLGTGPDDDPAGRYELSLVNGSPAPYRIPGSATGIKIAGRIVVLTRQKTFQDEVTLQVTTASGMHLVPILRAGTYRHDVPRLTLHFEDGNVVEGEVDRGTMTFTDGGMDFVLKR